MQRIKSILSSCKQKRAITPLDITIFLRQFAALLTAGIPILQCFRVLEKNQGKIAMHLLIDSIKHELLSGKNLYTSLSTHKKYFNEMTCQLIKIGEHTGNLDTTLKMIADEHERQLAFIRQIKHALFYPCVISFTALLVTVSMFLFIIPKFSELFTGTHIPLPALTRCLFFLSAQLNQHLFLLCLPVLCISFLYLPHAFSRKIKKSCQKRLHQFSFMQKILLARFARNLATMFAAGIPITDALRLLMNANYPEFTHTILRIRSKLHAGLHLHQAMQSTAYFPDLMLQMVKIGEESGSLDHMLNKAADFFETDIEHLLRQFSRLLEPLIMLVLGVLIGALIIGMYLPIFKLGSAL
jgi:type IV pilus assembly protein PilC